MFWLTHNKNSDTCLTAPETCKQYLSICVAAPGSCIHEHVEPRWRSERRSEVPRGPGPLPAQGAALWVGHHGQVSAIPGAEPCYALGGAIRVQRILFSGMTLIVKVTEGGEPTRNNLVLGLRATELHQTWRKEVRVKSIQNTAVDYRTDCDIRVSRMSCGCASFTE